MPDLRTDLDDLRDEWQSHAPHEELWYHDAASRLTALLAKHADPAAPKAGEWRGPYRCGRCGRFFDHHVTNSHRKKRSFVSPDGSKRCTGALVPYERRKGGEG